MTDGASPLPEPRESPMLDDSIRGVPPGTSRFDAASLAAAGWHPADGQMALPVLTLDEAAFAGNAALFLRYAREQRVEVAPHGKTPMAPDLARYLVATGAWGASVADIRQAGVMLRAGLHRLIIANEVGGAAAARRLAALVGARPEAELHVFADSVPAVHALAEAWQAAPALKPLAVLVETGAGRAGAREPAEAEAVAEAVLATNGRLRLAGVATYEGAAVRPDPAETQAAIERLLALTGEVFSRVRALAGPEAPLILTAGGSIWFDAVIAALRPLAAADGKTQLVLRSGAIFFDDHGVYDRALAALDARGGFRLGGEVGPARTLFRPALRLWAEVLSRPEPGLAICGMGMRDVSFDLGFPTPLARHRDRVGTPLPAAEVVKLNDQHAFLALGPGADLAIGDVVEFGISHPCTCLDRYRVIFGTDPQGRVRHAYPTSFG